MRARKRFVVIAYDITDNRRRTKVADKILQFGGRINLSVFECMLTDSQLAALQEDLSKLIDSKTDKIALYTLCMDCYTKIVYIPEKMKTANNAPAMV